MVESKHTVLVIDMIPKHLSFLRIHAFPFLCKSSCNKSKEREQIREPLLFQKENSYWFSPIGGGEAKKKCSLYFT